MPWYAWVMVAMYALSTCLRIGSIGQPRVPVTPGDAVMGVIVAALFVWGIVALAH